MTHIARRLLAAALVPFLVFPACSSPGEQPAGGGTGPAARHGGLPTIPPGSIEKASAPVKLPGSGAVGDDGGATYTIPLTVPDGPRGMQPALSVVYRGDANGPLGVGWGLTGLSTIAPCSRTFAADGQADGVDRDGTDVFCLDGQRLVPPGQSYAPPPPAGATLYHTAVESFRRVIAFPNPHGGPMPGWFMVYEPDGGKSIYTAVHGHVMENEHAHSTPTLGYERVPLAYLRTQSWDGDGNRITYAYEDADAQDATERSLRIASIDYAYTGTVATRRIVFAYEPRPDPIVHYAGGIKTVIRSRLMSISMIAPSPTAAATVWKYWFSYTTSDDTQRSLLQTVRLYDQWGASSWIRSFAYSKADAGTAEHAATTPEFNTVSLSQNWGAIKLYEQDLEADWLVPTDTRVLLYDIDGDGDDDVLYRTHPSRVLGQWDSDPGLVRRMGPDTSPGYKRYAGALWLRRTGAGPGFGPRTDVSDELEPGMNDPLEQSGFTLAHLGKSRIADTNGDGALDLVVAATRIQFTEPSINPDDVDEWLFDHWEFGYASHALDAGAAVLGLDTALMKGPVLRGEMPIDLYGSHPRQIVTPPFQRALADLDGDGRPEAVDVKTPAGGIDTYADPDTEWGDPFLEHPYGLGYHAWPSTSLAEQVPSAGWSCNNGAMIVADVDGDGRQDVLAAETDLTDPTHHHQGIYRKISLDDATGTAPHGSVIDDGGTSMLWGGDCGAHDPDLVMGDWNGDGLVDALYPPGSYTSPSATPAWSDGENEEPLVRWNLGNGFGPIEPIGVDGPLYATELLEQEAPLGRSGLPVVWDKGTRTADLNADGRTDIIAFRQDNVPCVDLLFALDGAPVEWGWGCENQVLAYLSAGDHFEATELWTWGVSGASLAHGFTMSQVGDVTGDGAADLVHVADNRLRLLELPWRTTPDRLITVNDESAAYPLETFARTRAWWGDTPRSQAATPPPCAWPLSCPRGGFEVVRTHRTFVGTRPDGSAMYSTDIHQFETPRMSLLGAGSLGFFQHRIWNRERGRETVRVFQHAVPDEFGAQDYPPWLVFVFGGSLFYPQAQLPSLEYAITPRLPTPTPGELASTSVAPGLTNGAAVPVRVVSTERAWEQRSNPAQCQLTVLPQTTTVIEVDTTGTPDLDTAPATPRYTAVDVQGTAGGDRRKATTTYVHDALGNPTLVTTEVRGAPGSPVAATQRTETAYVSCPGPGCPSAAPDAWITGLPVRVAVTDYDADDPAAAAQSARVVRTSYDTNARPHEVRANAAGPGYAACATGNPNPESCEDKSTATVIDYEPAHGNPVTVTVTAFDAPTPRTTTTSWDADGVYPTGRVDPAGISTVELIHPAHGVPVLALDENSVISTASYDGFGRLISSASPGHATLTQSYAPVVNGNRRGIAVETSSQDGSWQRTITDELGRRIESALRGFAAAQTIYVTDWYDAYGELVASSRPAFALGAPYAAWELDRLGRETKATSAATAVTATAHTMFSTTTTDPEGHVSYVEHDLEGRIVEAGHLVGSQELGEVAFGYGAFDHPVTITDAFGHVGTRAYDGFGRVIGAVDPDAGTSAFAYDGFGDLVGETYDADTITHSYDALGRVLTTTDSDGGVETRSYDVGTGAKRRLVAATSADGVATAISYDALGRTFEITQTVDGTPRTVAHRYDDYSRLRHLFYPAVSGFDRLVLSYVYTATGYLSAINDASLCGLVPTYTTLPPSCLAPSVWRVEERDAWLAPARAKFGNNQLVLRDYDDDTGLLRQVSSAGITTGFHYDKDGLLDERTEGTRLEVFDHDVLHRVTDWTLTPPKDRSGIEPPPVTTRYSYTEIGDLYKVERGPSVTFSGSFGGDGKPHHLTYSSVGGVYSYDDRGRQTTGGGRTTVWTDHDLPRSMTTSAGTRTFLYDAFGDRAKRAEPGKTVTYLGKLYEHHTGATGTRDTFYVHGQPGVVAQIDLAGTTKTSRYYVSDSLGSTTVVEQGASVVERAYYDPFGGRVDVTGLPAVDPDATTAVGFTGHEEDGGGLINMRGRIYDRAQFRFLTPDPLVGDPTFGQAYNPYSYVYNNPLNLTDPSGYSVVKTASQQFDELRARTLGTAPVQAPPAAPVTPTVTASCDPMTNCAAALTPVVGTTTDDAGASADPLQSIESQIASEADYSGEMTPMPDGSGVPQSAAEAWAQFDEIAGTMYWGLGSGQSAYHNSGAGIGCGVGCGDGDPLMKLMVEGAATRFIPPVWRWRGAIAGLVSMGGHDTDEFWRRLGGAVLTTPWSTAPRSAADLGKDTSRKQCFGAGTPVQTAAGPRPIESLREGDVVLAYDPGTGRVAPRAVVRTFASDGVTLELELRSAEGVAAELRVTADHPFLACDGTWVLAGRLRGGDCVTTATSTARVESVGAPTTAEPVYNIEVAVDHTYVVGDALAVVHNNDCTKVLRDGEGATPAEMAASKGGPNAGKPVGAKDRQDALDRGYENGKYTCWRCGQTSTNPDNMHGGHANVPRSKGGNLSPENLKCEGAACNLSAGNRGAPSPGMSCAERGGCGTPYGRRD